MRIWPAIFAALAVAIAMVTGASCGFPEFPFGAAATDSGAASADGGGAPDDGSAAPDDGATALDGCARDCLGGACLGGRCQPVTLYADSEGGPGGIYVTDLGVAYFAQYYGNSVVRELPDGAATFVTTDIVTPVRVAGSTQTTFATGFSNGDAEAAQIVSISASGASRKIVAGPTVAGLPIAPWGIVVTGKLLVWTNALSTGSVMEAAQDGTLPTVLAVGGRPQEIAANAQYAWWIDATHSTLYRVSLTPDGGAAVLATPDFVDFVAYSAGHLYTASLFNTSSIGVVDDPSATGAPVRELVSRYVQLPGGAEPAVHSPHGIAVDDLYVYWLNGPSGGVLGSVVRTRLDGTGTPELLASGIAQPDQIAVTSTAIYWTSFTGTVQRLAKP